MSTGYAKLGVFEVRNCTGGFVKRIEMFVYSDVAEKYDSGVYAEWDVANEYTGAIFEAAGIKNYKCEGCYDSAYRAYFTGWADSVKATDNAAKGSRRLVVTVVMDGPDADQIDGVDDSGDLMDLLGSIQSGYFAGKITGVRE